MSGGKYEGERFLNQPCCSVIGNGSMEVRQSPLSHLPINGTSPCREPFVVSPLRWWRIRASSRQGVHLGQQYAFSHGCQQLRRVRQWIRVVSGRNVDATGVAASSNVVAGQGAFKVQEPGGIRPAYIPAETVHNSRVILQHNRRVQSLNVQLAINV
jgi:hypothetical protein